LPEGQFLTVAFSPDGKGVATQDTTGALRWWTPTGQGQGEVLHKDLAAQWQQRGTLAFLPDGNLLFRAATSVRTWNVPARSLQPGSLPAADYLGVVARNDLVVSSSAEGVRIANRHTGQVSGALPLGTGPLALDFAEQRLVCAAKGHTLQAWNTRRQGQESLLWVAVGHTDEIVGVGLAARRWVVSASADRTVRFWEAVSGHEQFRLDVPAAPTSLACDRGGRYVAAGCKDGNVYLWDAAMAATRGTLKEPSGGQAVVGISFSWDDRTLAVVAGNTLTGWNVEKVAQPFGPAPRPVPRPVSRPRPVTLPPVRFNLDAALAQPASRGQALLPVPDSSAVVRLLAFSADGTRLATVDVEGLLSLWDLKGEGRTAALVVHGGRPEALAFAPDGTVVATGGADGVLQLRDPRTGQPIHLMDLKSSIHGLAWSATSRMLVVRTDGEAKLIDLSAGPPRLVPQQKPITAHPCVMFLRDQVHFLPLSMSKEGPVRWPAAVWDDPTRRPASLQIPEVAISPTSSRVAVIKDGGVLLRDVRGGVWSTTLKPLTGAAQGVAFSPGGRFLAVSERRQIQLFDATTGTSRAMLWPIFSRQSGPAPLAFSPDGRTLAAGSGGRVHFWALERVRGAKADGPENLTAQKFELTLGGRLEGIRGSATALTFSPDSKYLAAVEAGGGLPARFKLWQVEGSRPVRLALPDRHPINVGTVAFTPDSKKVIVLSNKDLFTWEVTTGKRSSAPSGLVRSSAARLAVSPDGKRWAVAGAAPERGVIVLEADTATRQRHLPHDGEVLLFRFGADSRELHAIVSLYRNKEYELRLCTWDAATGTQTAETAGPKLRSRPWARALSADRTKAFLGLFNRSVQVWDTGTGKLKELAIDTTRGQPMTLALSPDDKWLAIGGTEGHVTLWDLAASKAITRIHAHELKPVYAIAFATDGKMLATGSGEPVIKLWDLAALAQEGQKLEK
jgi:WD40 repeat protein